VNDTRVRLDNSTSRSLIALGIAACTLAMPKPVFAQMPGQQPLMTKGQKQPAPPVTPAADRLAAATGNPGAAAKAQPAVTQVRPILNPRPIDTDHGPSEYNANFTSETPDEKTTHITVGRSIFIDTKHRLARVYITNPEILDSYTASPNQVVLTAKKADSKSYLVSSDMNVEQLRDSLKQALPNENIKVAGNESRVVLTGTVGSTATADAAVKLAGIYAKDVSNSMVVNTAQARQVRLEVKIVEVDRTKLNQFGFNFFGSGGQNPSGTTTGQFPSSLTTTIQNNVKTVNVTNPLNFFVYLNRFNVGATLQDLETMQLAQILAEPNITTMSGQKADFLAGGEFPFPIVQSSTTGAPVITLMFKPYGVKLQFTPVVNVDGTIDLTVAPEVSALDYTNAVNISGYTIPAISTRRAETQVVLKSGETFAISGLLDKRTTDLYSKTPGVANVPILGELFKSKGVNHSDNELMVIVTPIIVDPIHEDVPVPPVPQHPVPFLNNDKFDQELPKGAKK
jgi:pilus assembly protein CpaC